MPVDPRPPLVVVAGPTAVGKTEIAIQLAKHLAGEIISADSRLFYRGMDIGTAKPTPDQRQQVTHHLIDIADPDEIYNLATFQTAARQVISAIHERLRLPLLVGGTGQYVYSVIEAWDVPPVEPQPALRQVLERWGRQISPEGLHQRLSVLDPEAAKLIEPRNLRRTVRALEVILSTGLHFSKQRQRSTSPYQTLILGFNRPRQELYARIDSRIQSMLDAGFVDEVRELLDRGYSPELPALSAIGYREIVKYLLGNTSLEEAVVQIKRKTRIYVRRQANWFKTNDPDILWFDAGSSNLEEIEAMVHRWLSQIRQ